MNRREQIESVLVAGLAPSRVELIDEGHLHVGHVGARDGRGHFRLILVSERFHGLSALQRHRLVYATLGSLMETDIHALSIRALTEAEEKQ